MPREDFKTVINIYNYRTFITREHYIEERL